MIEIFGIIEHISKQQKKKISSSREIRTELSLLTVPKKCRIQK